MSEPSSLYMRVQLSEAALVAFKQSLPSQPNNYADWLPWLATKQFYGPIDTAKITTLTMPQGQTCGDYIKECVDSPSTMPTSERYDPATQTWTFVVGMFSENYFDFIEVLTLLRGLERYKDLPNPGFILLYPYFWGDAPNAYMVVEQGSSRFEEQIPAEDISEANATLKALANALADSFPDD